MTTTWARILPGTLRQITCKGANVVGRNEGKTIYQRNYTNNNWTELTGSATWVAAGIDYSSWHCNDAGAIYRSKPDNTGWDLVGEGKPSPCVQVDAWTRDRAVHVNKAGQFFEYQNNGWTRLDGSGTHITIGADGEKWHVNSAGDVYRMLPGQKTWQPIWSSTKLKSIHCTDGNNVAGVTINDLLCRWNSKDGTWSQLTGSGTCIGITWGSMWHVNDKSEIYQALLY